MKMEGLKTNKILLKILLFFNKKKTLKVLKLKNKTKKKLLNYLYLTKIKNKKQQDLQLILKNLYVFYKKYKIKNKKTKNKKFIIKQKNNYYKNFFVYIKKKKNF